MSLTKSHNRMIEGAAVNVLDFGAIGDGVTDSTTAIQAALDTGKPVVIPVGQFVISSTLSMVTEGQFVSGQGDNSELLLSSGFSGAAIKVGTDVSTSHIKYPRLEKFTIIGNQSDGEGGILLQNTWFANVRDVNVIETGDYGFKVFALGASGSTAYGGWWTTFFNCRADKISNSTDTGIAFYIGRKANQTAIFGGNAQGNCNLLIGEPNDVAADVPSATTVVGLACENTSVQPLYNPNGTTPKSFMYINGDSVKIDSCRAEDGSGVGDYFVTWGNRAANVEVTNMFGTLAFKQQYEASFSGGNLLFQVRQQTRNYEMTFANNGGFNVNAPGSYRAYSIKNKTDTDPRFLLNGAGQLFFGDGASSVDVALKRIATNTVGVSSGKTFAPEGNGTSPLGAASNRWSEVFAANGTINTSDENQKQDIRALSEKEISVGKKLKHLVKAYRFKDAVSEKGEDARIHVGVIAQEVKAVFESEGLDGFKYGVLCFNSWDQKDELIDHETGEVLVEKVEAGSQYGVRYSQLWAFIISAL